MTTVVDASVVLAWLQDEPGTDAAEPMLMDPPKFSEFLRAETEKWGKVVRTAGIAGLAVGIPSLRLRGDYLAIVTFAFGESIRLLASTPMMSSFTNGALGFAGVPTGFGKSVWWTFGLLAITVFVMARLKSSSYGRALQGIGAGAIQPIGMTVIGDLYSVEERAKVQGYVASVWGIASVAGAFVAMLVTVFLKQLIYLNTVKKLRNIFIS